MNNDAEPTDPWESTDFRLIIGRSKIDYDRTKEKANRKKHGFSLESAVHFLEGMLLPLGRPPVVTSDPVDCNGEIRHQHMTVDTSGEVVFFVTTMRADETVRVISFRRASAEEEAIYRQACLRGEVQVPKKR